MKQQKWFRNIAVFSLAILGFFAIFVRPHRALADSPRVIEITVKRFEFTPNKITLKKGETVTLRLNSADVTHGFFLRPLRIDAVIAPDKPTDATVTPETAGTFTTICDHFCGVNHGNMKMTIVVE